ncbi:MAG: hypothetical protein JWN81_2309, partial [Solirubrobacterales bacterium]|nr:hypothetical protein [Solirubrobacterales bacterium]
AGLALALRAVLEDPAAAAQRAQAGRRLIEEQFDIERSADRMLELFEVSAPSAPVESIA